MNKLPNYLYKYRSLTGTETRRRTIQILEDELVYYPRFPELNDPFDGHVVFMKNIGIEDLKGFAEEINSVYPDSPTDYRSFLKQNGKLDAKKVKRFCEPLSSTREMFPDYGVLCLSETSTSILMWAHYSQFSGIAIELDVSEFEKASTNKLLKVQYKSNYPKIKITDFRPSNDDAVMKIFTQKFSHWKYEKEWRLITRYGGSVQKLPAKISGVVLGPLIDTKAEFDIRKIATQKKWKISKLRESKTSYRLFID